MLNIGFLIDWISSPYHIELVIGLEQAAKKHNVNLVTFAGGALYSPKTYERNSDYLYRFLEKDSIGINFDCMIIESGLLGLYSSREQMAGFLEHYKHLPIVSLSNALENITSLLIENRKGLQTIIYHLIDDHGFKKIAFLSGPADNPDSQERFTVYKECLNSRGISYDPGFLLQGDFVKKSGRLAVRKMLSEQKILPRAIVAANDDMAIGAILELSENGFKVPGDIAVVGFDDQKDSEYFNPHLTTVRRPIFELGEKAVLTAISLKQGEPVEKLITLSTQPVIRQSCGCNKDTAKTSFNIQDHFEKKNLDTQGISHITSCSLLPGEINSILNLVEVYRNIGYISDVKRLMDFLNFAFPQIGISSCYFIAFKDNDTNLGEILLSYNTGTSAFVTEKNQVIDVKKFISEQLLFKDKQQTMRFFSMNFDNIIPGITVYQVDSGFNILHSAMQTNFLLNIINAVTIHSHIKADRK